jgi:perosamine synthetase
VMRRGVLANGPEAAALEEEFAAYCDVPHAVAVSSGTAALVLAGQALGLGPGDTILVSGFTFAATANAFLSLGCRVVPVDVHLDTMNMDAVDLDRAIAATNPRAVVLVDLYGSTSGTEACVEATRAAELLVVEDAAQAHGAHTAEGARVGGRADATTFSLYATKNMAAGEGGLVTTPMAETAESLRRLRSHGALEQYRHEVLGLNHRLPEMEAALARRQLARLEDANAERRARARELAAWCADAWGDRAHVPEEALSGDGRHVFHQFTVRFTDPGTRDAVASELRTQGVDARQFYPYVVADLPGIEHRPTAVAERLRDTVLSVPVHPGLTAEQWEHLQAAMKRAARAI